MADFDPTKFVGLDTKIGRIISVPRWDDSAQMWTALVDAGALLLVELNIKYRSPNA